MTVNFISFGQSVLSKKYESIRGKSLFLQYNIEEDKAILKFFTGKEKDDAEPLINKEYLGLKYGFTNIFMRWINPLKYEVTWKDSIYVDTTEKSVSDFFDLLTSQFGPSVTNLKQNDNDIKKGSTGLAISPKITKFYVPPKGYNSVLLMEMYFRLVENFNKNQVTRKGNIKTKQIDNVNRTNKILEELYDLDSYNSKIISKEVNIKFTELLEITDPYKVNAVINSIDSDGWKEHFKKIDRSIEKVEGYLETQFITSNDLLYFYSNTVITNFIGEVKKRKSANEKLVKKLIPFVKKLEKSIEEESDIKNYFYVRDIKLEEGKAFSTEIKINKIEIDTSKKSEISKSKIVFVEHDWVHISVSTGIFYSSTTLKGFGVSDNLTITEDNITKNNPVTAIFLNFNFGIGSRYFAPLTQIGIDPTKKRPFLLLGGGFSIPSSGIAFTGGPIWTWSPTLDKLSVGQTIASTTDLENDIQYKFEVEPKGWYLGIQYIF